MGKSKANRENRKREEAAQRNQEPQAFALTIELTNHDVANLIAFGNRAQMTGQEADTWVRLKHGLIGAVQQAEAEHDRRIEVPPGPAAIPPDKTN